MTTGTTCVFSAEGRHEELQQPTGGSAALRVHDHLQGRVPTCVLSARGWNPHFSSTDARTRSGVVSGVKPAAATRWNAQLMIAISSKAPALAMNFKPLHVDVVGVAIASTASTLEPACAFEFEAGACGCYTA
jgi:hypothetical protein